MKSIIALLGLLALSVNAGSQGLRNLYTEESNQCFPTSSKICTKEGGFCTTDEESCKKKGLAFVSRGCTKTLSVTTARLPCGCCIDPEVVNPSNYKTRKTQTTFAILSGDGNPSDPTDPEYNPNFVSATFEESRDGYFQLSALSFVQRYQGSVLAQTRAREEFVSFEMNPKFEVLLQCKPETQCSFTVKGFVHSDQVDIVYPPKPAGYPQDGKSEPVFPGFKIAASAEVSLVLPSPNTPKGSGRLATLNWSTEEEVKGINQVRGQTALPDGAVKLLVTTGKTPLNPNNPAFELLVAPWWEWKKHICLQPVRVRNRKCQFELFGICFGPTYSYSGKGLAFGKPATELLWAKADVTFTWRPWVTIYDNDNVYESVTTGEMASLRAKVNNPNCVEIFFVKKFSPSSTYGGGACWSSGTSNAKIISSDEQVACGVDKTHLAHEVGHAIGLMHPGTNHPTLEDGSTGTLMCPSGWKRDNPSRNSYENKSNIQNPLLINYLGNWNWLWPDCTNSGTCGPCVLVNEPCV